MQREKMKGNEGKQNTKHCKYFYFLNSLITKLIRFYCHLVCICRKFSLKCYDVWMCHRFTHRRDTVKRITGLLVCRTNKDTWTAD